MTELEEYYNKFNEEKRLNSRHGQVEFITSMKYIHEYLDLIEKKNKVSDKSEISILDIGAGTGRYSVPLCEEGYDVTAVELVKHNLGRLKQKSGNVKAYQGNALKLSKFKDNSFDLTLLFGPMYHLHSREDKIKALNEAKRVTKKNGYILVAYIMNGMLEEDFHCNEKSNPLYSFMRLEDIDSLNEEVGIKRKKIIAADGAANYIRPFLNDLDEEEFGYFIKYNLSICERMELMGATSHTVDILCNE